MSVNRTVISGNLTRNPDMRRTQSGMAVMEFSVAVNERRKNGNEREDYANYVDCTLFGTRAEAIENYLGKGTHVTIDGHLRQDRWEKDGQKRSKLKLIVDDIDFSGNSRRAEQRPEPSPEPVIDAAQTVYDDDIPF